VAAALVVIMDVILAVVVVVDLMAASMVMVVLVLMAVALLVMVVMVMIVAVAFDVLVELVVEPRVLKGMVHDVLQLMFVDIENGAHEREVDLLLRFQVAMFLDPVAEVGQVECDPATVVEGYGRLDVAEERASFGFDPFAHLKEGLGESCLRIRVVAVDSS
jgi:hypothetical protein